MKRAEGCQVGVLPPVWLGVVTVSIKHSADTIIRFACVIFFGMSEKWIILLTRKRVKPAVRFSAALFGNLVSVFFCLHIYYL